ncbi:MAG: stage 0 sporulation family protein [Oscillospiraceae bacterium]|nr:stage 0 sporulation family protein [Oscillospiraceae bacterium]
MTEIISVRFKAGGKQYYFSPNGLSVRPGDGVILETARGQEYGECVHGNMELPDGKISQPLRSVIRIATEKDMQVLRNNQQKEASAFDLCQKRIAARGLDMKLISAEYSFDGNKVLFTFTSENRVDFRTLVKDLASALHARIELWQIGVRDEARKLGGLGICGKPFCCSTFLDEFQPVSIKMAKTQNLSLNPIKISGTCGRLMCCLKYEQDAYEDLLKRAPKPDSFVETPDGVGTVTGINLLRETVKVRLEDQPDSPRCFHNCELCVVRSGRGKMPENYTPPSREELEKLRKVTPREPPPTVGLTENLAGLAHDKQKPDGHRRKDAPAGRKQAGQPPAQKKGKAVSASEKQKAAPAPAQEDTVPLPNKAEKRPNRNRRRPYYGKNKKPQNKPGEG